MRKVKDAIDLNTGEKVYFRGHAQTTYMSDGRTVEQAIKSGGGSGGSVSDYVADFCVEDLDSLVEPPHADRILVDVNGIVAALQGKSRILIPYEAGDGYALLVGYADDLLYAKVISEYKTYVITAQYGQKDWIAKDEVSVSGGESYDDTELQNKLTELSEEIESNGQLIEDLQNMKIDKENDDYYPMMAVGLADNLAGVDVVDSEINFRRSGGGAITDGVARIESIKGNSVVWNQCFGRGTQNAGTWDGNILTINGAYSSDVMSYDVTADNAEFVAPIANHKYYVSIEIISGTIVGDLEYVVYPALPYTKVTLNNSNKAYQGIINQIDAINGYWFIRIKRSGSEFTNLKVRHVIYDLTKMFGSGNEPTTIEEFYARIPMGVDLNAYNEGEVIHMDVQSVESQGVNAWDEEITMGAVKGDGTFEEFTTRISTSLIEVLPNKKYYLTGPSSAYNGRYAIYDENKRVIYADTDNGVTLASKTFTTPSNAKYACITFGTAYGTTYNHNICINLSDTSVNGKYFPYIKRVEDLSLVAKYFPQGMKSAGSAHDEIRYNKQTNKWEKVEAIGIRAYQEGDADNASYLTDGKVTCYPLAEPIVTELDEADQFKDLDYQVWNAGTEKAIAEGKSAPLAADITYGFNAIGKIKELESLVAALRAKVGI